MSWWKKITGAEVVERLQEEQDQAQASYRAINVEIIRAMAEQNGIEMAQCHRCGAWYIVSRAPWCDCQA